MAIAPPTLTYNFTANPATVIVKTDPTSPRNVVLTATDRGSTATVNAIYPVQLTDSSGRAWSKVSDDGLTAVYE
jgi:hypothetical protein